MLFPNYPLVFINDLILPYYSSLVKNRLVHVEGFGYWIIDTVTEIYDGGVPQKQIHCYSYDYSLNYKAINLLDGTYKFYDIVSPENTLLYQLMLACPDWKIGNVDTELLNLYRTFDTPDGTLYGFLMDDVSNTYEVIFEFDTENLTINAYKPNNIVKNTDIMLTFDNINKDIQIEELTTDIYTVLQVNGADNLSINIVNPLGDNRLYNFDYYNNESWISDANLRNKITTWQNEIEELREPYNTWLNERSQANKELLQMKTELRDLQSELSALEIVRKNLIDQPEEFKKQTDLIDAKELEIKEKENDILNKEHELSDIEDELKTINESIRFDKYFTQEEQKFLNRFIIESVYTDENFIVTEQMKAPADADGDTLVLTTNGTKPIKDLEASDILIDEQYIANQLLEQGREILETVCQPSFQFSMSAVNFLFVEKFEPFIKQLDLGCVINIEIEEGNWAYPALLEMQIDYDNPDSFTMTFGNRFRLSDAEWTYADLHNETQKVSNQVGTSLGVAVEPVLNGQINDMSEYMANNLIAANQMIQSTVDNEVSFGSFGLRCKKADDNYPSGYDPHQFWLNNNLLCMTDDNWQSVKLAIGFINGYYSVNAEIIAGNLIAGNQLVIQDGTKGNPSTFIVDSDGARLTNASFTLTTLDNKGKIVLNPQNGIRIQTNTGSGFKDRFYVNTDGVIKANGLEISDSDLTDTELSSGLVGGFNITPERIYSNQMINNPNSLSNGKTGNTVPVVELRIDSSGNLGMLSWNGTNARFDGNIFAKNLDSNGFTNSVVNDKFANLSIGNAKISDLSADKLTAGTIDANKINVINLDADNITAGTIDASIISVINLNADNIVAGTISGNRIEGGVIRGVTIQGGSLEWVNSNGNIVGGIYQDQDGYTYITASNVINLDAPTIEIPTSDLWVRSLRTDQDCRVSGTLRAYGDAQVDGILYADDIRDPSGSIVEIATIMTVNESSGRVSIDGTLRVNGMDIEGEINDLWDAVNALG